MCKNQIEENEKKYSVDSLIKFLENGFIGFWSLQRPRVSFGVKISSVSNLHFLALLVQISAHALKGICIEDFALTV